MVFQLLFFRRFLISLDIAVIVLAAPAIATVTAAFRQHFLRLLVPAVAAGALLTIFAVDYADTEPLIQESELVEIERLDTVVPADAFVMATDSFYAPWILGYTDRRTIAPGLFEFNQWNRAEWNRFWRPRSPEDRYDLLDRYNRDIYLFVGEQQRGLGLQDDPRFESVTPKLWRYTPRR